MKKHLLLAALLLPFNTMALEVIHNDGGTSTATCTEVTQYSDGSSIRSDDVLTYTLYMNDTEIQAGLDCSFTLAHTLPVGSNVMHVTAKSSFYNAESVASNTIDFNLLPQLSPNSPTQFNITVQAP